VFLLRALYRFRWYRRFSRYQLVRLRDGWYRLDKIPVSPLPTIIEDDLTLRKDYQQFVIEQKEEENERPRTTAIRRDF